MKLKDFIEYGLWTVPLKGELKRNENGEKNTPKFPDNWNILYRKKRNETDSDLGLILTGRDINLIAIDADNEQTLKIFLSLDNNNPLVYHSVGKPAGGGTILYKLDSNSFNQNNDRIREFHDLVSFRIKDFPIELDFYSDNGAVYAPTEGNKTKEQIENINITTIPEQVIKFLLLLKKTKEIKVIKEESLGTPKYLAPDIKEFLVTKEFNKHLWSIITPKSFRNKEKYKTQGYITPKDIKKGERSDYLVRLSAILGADESIDETVYVKFISEANSLLPEPLKDKELLTNIINPMLSGRAKVDGKPLWRYDENWQKTKLVIKTKTGEKLYIFYDAERMIFYAVDLQNRKVKSFSKENDILSYINIVGERTIKKPIFQQKIALVKALQKPTQEFGFYEKAGAIFFNLFTRKNPLAIINNPQIYKNAAYPKYTLAYFESLIPDKQTREYIFKFLRTKFTTFNYSPVIFYFLGTSGSGKDLFVNWLSNFLPSENFARPSVREFLEQYNSWLVDKYFVQLDEYGDKVSSVRERNELLGQLKTYSGSEIVQIRPMRQTGYNYRHNITFILTANRNPLVLDEFDRRFVLIETPNKLKDLAEVKELGGTEEFIYKLKTEIKDFAFWLATKYSNLSSIEYTTALDSELKKTSIADKLTGAQKIVYLLKEKMFEKFEELAYEYDVQNVITTDSHIDEDSLLYLYSNITDGNGKPKTIIAYMKQAGFIRKSKVTNGIRSNYFIVPGLEFYESNFNPFE